MDEVFLLLLLQNPQGKSVEQEINNKINEIKSKKKKQERNNVVC